MRDAYAAQRCHAIAGEATWLAGLGGRGSSAGRILPDALNVFPVIAATGTADGRWSAIVAWTINTLVNGARPDTTWYAGGAAAMPLAVPQLGLAPGWQQRVLDAVGNYGAIAARHLGADAGAPQRSDDTGATPEPALLPYVE